MRFRKHQLSFSPVYNIIIYSGSDKLSVDTILMVLDKNDIFYKLRGRSKVDGSYKAELICSKKQYHAFSRDLRSINKTTRISFY